MNDLFLRACRREPVDSTPIWIMRQAGRYLPEYREVRKRVDFLTLCKTPELAAEVTIQPIDRFGFDAAILFSDILTIAEPMGFEVTFNPGPVIGAPVRTAADVERVREFDPEEELPFVYETIRILRRELEGRVPLIGFAAAPFTLAAYLAEGQGSRNFVEPKRLILGDPTTAHRFLDKVSAATERYVTAQVRAGAQAIQLFDTWAGLLTVREYREFGLRYAARVIESTRRTGVPVIYFALDAAHLMGEVAGCGSDVVGLDWRAPVDESAATLGDSYAVQGNLDPCVLFAPPDVVRRQTREILERARGLPGHIFNLGHGVLPGTPVEHVEAMVRAVRGQD